MVFDLVLRQQRDAQHLNSCSNTRHRSLNHADTTIINKAKIPLRSVTYDIMSQPVLQHIRFER